MVKSYSKNSQMIYENATNNIKNILESYKCLESRLSFVNKSTKIDNKISEEILSMDRYISMALNKIGTTIELIDNSYSTQACVSDIEEKFSKSNELVF